jgi:predicted SAM-dependent methyltransferase
MRVTALDISASALRQYKQNNPQCLRVKHASILDTGFADASFDGIYNLGVMEHFTEREIVQIFTECHRLLIPGGKLLMFWPHSHAPSVFVLRLAGWLLNSVLKKNVQFHPAEVSLLRSRRQVKQLLAKAGFEMLDCRLTARDLFIQAVIVAAR